ncbi:putative peptide-transporting ATPase [Lupinus albus]|uniref:Putative peptide-transporting ATPase n=1 Tax=Lupinus albus TaxID=3870 RepID=A0A6A4PBY9_LUPAL|nr:putative peptide-transporting ATPase [Lupinus albus]
MLILLIQSRKMLLNANFNNFPHSKLLNSQTLKPNTFFTFTYHNAASIKENHHLGFHNILGKRVCYVSSILPGRSWWTLPENRENDAVSAEPTAVIVAVRQMWHLVADQKFVTVVAIGSLVVAALSEISIPSILAASIFSAQGGEATVFSKNALLLVLLCLTSGICSGLRSGCFGILNVTLVKRLRENLYTAILFQDISYFDKEKVGNLTSRLAADCQKLSHVIGNDLHLILHNTLRGTGAMVNLLALSWPLALSALVICLILSAIFLVYGQYQREATRLTQDFEACANEAAQESLSLIRIVRAYGTEKKELDRYNQWLQRLAFINSRESVANGFWSLSFSTLYRSTQIFAVVLGGMSVLSCYITTEQLTKYSIGASEKLFQLMSLLPSDQFLAKGVKLQRLMGQIQFVNVSFHYPSRIMMPVVDHLNFSVEPNEVIAIVGLSGSGKSTLLNLLLRLYEPSSGQISIDGFPLEELDIMWLRQNIGYVAQEPHLFHMDIKSNIKYGCSMDKKQEDIERAAKQAYAHDFISSLPDGYETLVDDNVLSGGQKQRIAIARALLRDPVILILDEPTSALDSESEHYVKEILCPLKDESKSRTIIILTHRLSTIESADRIFAMEGGRIIEMGNHEELVLKDGLYAKLNRFQSDILA